MAVPYKYQAKEVLNKVLNSGEDALKVDIDNVTLDGSQLSVDIDKENDSIVIFSNTAADGSGTNTVPLVDAAGHTQVDIVSSALPSGGATAANQSTIIGHVDGVETLLGTIDSDTDAIKTSLGNIDNAVDGNYLNVNMNLAGSDAQAGEGAISATTQRVTIATDDDGVAHLATIAGAVSTQMQVDVGAISAQSDGTYIGDIKFGESLPAGTAAIGKLAANDGVDIGDVDVTSVTTGHAAANLGKREDDVHANQDVGVMALAVRNDDVAAIGAADGDYAPLQVNAAGSLYTTDATGEAGSILVTGTSAVTTGISGTKFIAIQFIEDTVFASSGGLVAASEQLYPDDTGVGSDISSNGAAIDSVTFPQGMTIFGRWNGFTLASGKVIGYIGYV